MLEDGGDLVAIDTWEGGAEHVNGEMTGAEERFNANMALLKEKFPNRTVIKEKATPVARCCLQSFSDLINSQSQIDELRDFHLGQQPQ